MKIGCSSAQSSLRLFLRQKIPHSTFSNQKKKFLPFTGTVFSPWLSRQSSFIVIDIDDNGGDLWQGTGLFAISFWLPLEHLRRSDVIHWPIIVSLKWMCIFSWNNFKEILFYSELELSGCLWGIRITHFIDWLIDWLIPVLRESFFTLNWSCLDVYEEFVLPILLIDWLIDSCVFFAVAHLQHSPTHWRLPAGKTCCLPGDNRSEWRRLCGWPFHRSFGP